LSLRLIKYNEGLHVQRTSIISIEFMLGQLLILKGTVRNNFCCPQRPWLLSDVTNLWIHPSIYSSIYPSTHLFIHPSIHPENREWKMSQVKIMTIDNHSGHWNGINDWYK